MNPQVLYNLLYHSYPIDIPCLSWCTSWLYMVISDTCHLRWIPCSQCSHIHWIPFVLDDRTDVPLKECWFTRPQLYFTTYLRPRMGGRQQAVARMVRMTQLFSSWSTAPFNFKVLDLPVQVQWKLVTLWSCTSPLQHPSSMWAQCWGKCPWCPCFSVETLCLPSCTAVFLSCRAAIPICTAVQTLPRSRAGRKATSMSLVWGQPMVVALWEWQASSGGSVSFWDRSAANGCDARRG